MGMNGIFAAGDGVLLRVGRPTAPAAQAIWLADVLTRVGLRVPQYLRQDPFLTDDHAVFAIGAIDAVGPVDWAAVGEMIALLHRIDPKGVAQGYPLPFCGDFPWWDFETLLSEVGSDLDASSRSAIVDAIDRSLPQLDEQRSLQTIVCHGDVHPGNVLQSDEGPVVLDWDLLCSGPSSWDHAPLMTWTERWGGEPGIYEAFAEGYGCSYRGDRLGGAIAELRLVAATLMRLRAARLDPTAAEEAELRLRYWRGEADAPQWHAQ
jgi:Ser/Thr protein kinase RdoA (MazF antagonist)